MFSGAAFAPLSGAAPGSPLRHSAKRCATSPAGGGKCTCVNHDKVCGKAKSQKSSPYHKVSRCSRAYTWLSLRESWHRVHKRPVPERGENKQCGGQPLQPTPAEGPYLS